MGWVWARLGHLYRTERINGRIIIEVLSKSTQAYDRGEKFSAYKTIATFQEYILLTLPALK